MENRVSLFLFIFSLYIKRNVCKTVWYNKERKNMMKLKALEILRLGTNDVWGYFLTELRYTSYLDRMGRNSGIGFLMQFVSWFSWPSFSLSHIISPRHQKVNRWLNILSSRETENVNLKQRQKPSKHLSHITELSIPEQPGRTWPGN